MARIRKLRKTETMVMTMGKNDTEGGDGLVYVER